MTVRAWLAIALAGLLSILLTATHWQAYRMGADKVQAAWVVEQLSQAQQSLVLQAQAQAATEKLKTDADQLRKSKNAQIARLDADLAAALAGLSDRAPRPGAVDLPTPSGSGANPGCTGASLWREDGQFLSRESARADRLLADLAQCQTAYGKARDALR
jgi:hypothetical protein